MGTGGRSASPRRPPYASWAPRVQSSARPPRTSPRSPPTGQQGFDRCRRSETTLARKEGATNECHRRSRHPRRPEPTRVRRQRVTLGNSLRALPVRVVIVPPPVRRGLGVVLG